MTFHPLTFPKPKARVNLNTTVRLALQVNACRGAFNKVVSGLWPDQLDRSKTDLIPQKVLTAGHKSGIMKGSEKHQPQEVI